MFFFPVAQFRLHFVFSAFVSSTLLVTGDTSGSRLICGAYVWGGIAIFRFLSLSSLSVDCFLLLELVRLRLRRRSFPPRLLWLPLQFLVPLLPLNRTHVTHGHGFPSHQAHPVQHTAVVNRMLRLRAVPLPLPLPLPLHAVCWFGCECALIQVVVAVHGELLLLLLLMLRIDKLIITIMIMSMIDNIDRTAVVAALRGCTCWRNEAVHRQSTEDVDARDTPGSHERWRRESWSSKQ